MTRTALVTGGASGIGRATAERFAADQLRVLTADLSPEADFTLDVASSEDVRRVMGEVGPVDVLVNCAGIVGPTRPLWELNDDEWDRVMAVNVTGTFHLCRAAVPGMVARGWGRIVNVASISGKEGDPNLSAYSASKAAVIALTKSLGKELATTGVLVNAVAPAVIATPMISGNFAVGDDVLVGPIPMRRLGQAAEVAELIAWLCSDRCSFSTGAVYDISGGRATY